MGHYAKWLVENRILFFRLNGEVKVQDIPEADALVCDYLDKGTPLIHMIIDVDKLEKFPVSLALLKRKTHFVQHPALGWALLVGKLGIMRFIAVPLASMFKLRYKHFDTLGMAVDFLKEQDKTIDWEAAAGAFQSTRR